VPNNIINAVNIIYIYIYRLWIKKILKKLSQPKQKHGLTDKIEINK